MNPLLSAEFVTIVVLSTIGLIVLLLFRPSLLSARGGAVLLLVALFILPVASMRAGFRVHWESSKSTEFCMSCHVMEPYGQSLVVADDEYLPAAHFQNRRIPYDKACFACHSTYTMFGDTKAKLNGMNHLWTYFTNQTPEKIELYEPFNNRECLACHRGARQFVEEHEDDMDELMTNETLCLECHDVGHEVETLDTEEMWKSSLKEAVGAQ
jgi:nitrate/TMAO reductase-like tetraheme cytochrome c subunit